MMSPENAARYAILQKVIATASDKELFEVLAKKVAHLSDEEIDTLMFAFFLCYFAERDIGFALTEPFKELAKIYAPEFISKMKGMYNSFLNKDKFDPLTLDEALNNVPDEAVTKIKSVISDRYLPKPLLDVDDIGTFEKKLAIYSKSFGMDNVATVLYDLKKVRNDISHGRIIDIKYKGRPLIKREVKEEAFFDYMSAVLNPDDHSASPMIAFLKANL